MDYVNTKKQKKLYVGTNRGVILAIDIEEQLEMISSANMDPMAGFGDMDMDEFIDKYRGIQPDDFDYDQGDYGHETNEYGEKNGPPSPNQKLKPSDEH